MESLEIHYTDEAGASEKTAEEVCPGQPFIIFTATPSVAVVLENPLPRSGLFTISNDITNGETTKQFNEKIAKIVGLKGKQLNILEMHFFFQVLQLNNIFRLYFIRC